MKTKYNLKSALLATTVGLVAMATSAGAEENHQDRASGSADGRLRTIQ